MAISIKIKVDDKGRILLPSLYRKAAGIKPGETVKCNLRKNCKENYIAVSCNNNVGNKV